MATITSNSGNVNVSFFPTNVNPVNFCDKNTGGINIAANGAPVFPNTIYLGNQNTTSNVSGRLAAALINTSTPLSTENSTVVPTTAWVTSNFAKSVGTFNTDAISGTNWNASNLNVSILKTATPSNSENSVVVPNTAWVHTNFGDLATGNTWAGVNTFGNLSTSQVLPATDSTTAVPPSSWVTSNFGAKAAANTWSGTNAFGTVTATTVTATTLAATGAITAGSVLATGVVSTNIVPAVGSNTSVIPPSSWVTSNFGAKTGGNTWTGLNLFNSLASSQTIGSTDSTTTVATTSWVTGNFPKLSGSNTWSNTNFWSSTNYFNQGLETSVFYSPGESSNKVPSTSWVSTNFAKLFNTNSWNSLNYFNQGLETTVFYSPGESSNKVPSTSWVATNFPRLSGINTWTNTNTFNNLNSTQTIASTESSNVVATTSWVGSNFPKLTGINSWSAANTFNNLNSTQSIASTESSNVVATTSWVATYFAKVGAVSSGGTTPTASSNVSATTLYVSTNASFACPISTLYSPITIRQGQIGHIVYGSMALAGTSTQFGTEHNIATIPLYSGVWQVHGRLTWTPNQGGYSANVIITRNTTFPTPFGTVWMNASTSQNTTYTNVQTLETQIETRDFFIEENTTVYNLLFQSNIGGTINRDRTIFKALRIA